MATVTTDPLEELEQSWYEPPGLISWFTTVDHKRIGMKYLVTALAFFVFGGIESLIIRAQLGGPELHLISPEAYNQLFSMHGVTMMFLFAMPVLSGFGNFFVPLMVGARDMAFPRLNAFGYWVFLAAGIFLYSAFLIGRAPDAGWFAYTPLSDPRFTPGINIHFYTLVLPALGVVSAIIPSFVRRRMVGYTWIVVAEMATALIGFGVWTHHMFVTGLPQVALSFVSLVSFMITIPSGVQIFAWVATLIAGRPVLRTPLLFVIGFILVFVLGGLSGVMFAAIPFDAQVHDSYFVVAHFHYVMVGAVIFPLFGALYYWLPKMTGKLMSERWGKASFWTIFVGFNLAFFPMHIAGILGQPRRTYTYQAGLGWTAPNLISTVGSFLLGLGILITFVNWVWSLRRGAPAPNDPWGGDTLEWATTSPPPEYNFAAVPTVRSLEPVWDQPELRDGAQPPDKGGRALVGGHLTLSTSMLDGTPRAVIAMPHATAWPLAATAGLLLGFWGVVFGAWLLGGAGALLFAAGMVGWHWPRGETQEG